MLLGIYLLEINSLSVRCGASNVKAIRYYLGNGLSFDVHVYAFFAKLLLKRVHKCTGIFIRVITAIKILAASALHYTSKYTSNIFFLQIWWFFWYFTIICLNNKLSILDCYYVLIFLLKIWCFNASITVFKLPWKVGLLVIQSMFRSLISNTNNLI